MNNSPKISRRDWFRLRVPHQNQSLSKTAPTEQSEAAPQQMPVSNDTNDVLRPIEQPPNHDGMDLAELPPMREAVLSIEQVESLFLDIGKLATDVLLMKRSAGSQRAQAASVDSSSQLEIARSAILTGQLQKVQIRYRWQDSLWIDTLSTQADGFRLVRIEHRQ